MSFFQERGGAGLRFSTHDSTEMVERCPFSIFQSNDIRFQLLESNDVRFLLFSTSSDIVLLCSTIPDIVRLYRTLLGFTGHCSTFSEIFPFLPGINRTTTKGN